MAIVLSCTCGYTIRGSSEDEFVANAYAHARAAHPDLVATLDRANLIAMAQVE